MTRILLTGATGFIGRHVLEHLAEEEHEVHAVGRNPLKGSGEENWHAVDLLDADETAQLLRALCPEILIHLAWDVRPGYTHASDNTRWKDATVHLFHAFAKNGGNRFVGAGTCLEYGMAGRLSEDQTTRPDTPYGRAKDSAFKTITTKAQESGVSAAWGRIFYLFGPHEGAGRLVPSVARSLLAGDPALCTSGTQRRDFLHVDDVAAAFACIASSNLDGPINIGSGTAVPVREIVQSLAEIAGRPDLVRLGVLPAPPGDPPIIEAEIGRLTDNVGFHPRFTLQEGLADAFAWWSKHPPANTIPPA